jgi:histone demethylase JARID1
MQPASHEGPSAGHLDTSAPADALQPAADGSMPVGAEEAPAQDAPPAEPEEPPPYGFRPGEQHSLASLERYSRFFKAKYFCTKTGKPKADLQLTDIEAEFWRLVEDSSSRGGATGVAEVVYGADIQTSEVGSGFPSEATSNGDPALLRYAHAPANVCNMPFQPGSCLRPVEKTTGISVPWLYFGMTLSAFCWHVEDHHFYSVNYHHFGAPKVWYSVPASHSARLEAYMQSKLPHLFAAQPGLLHALVTLVSPQALVEAGIPVYRAVQEPGCYIITFPFAYHAGFNAGFNCAEATNFAPADWLPFGLDASERYSQDARYCSVAHDKMLMELGTAAARSSNGKRAEEAHDAATVHPSLPPTIAAELDRRTLLEVQRRGGASCWVSGEERMSNAEVAFCADNDCAVCLADLHISAIFCKCSPDQPTCLRHVGCACRASDRTLKFKYSLQEMRDLAHAVRDVASDRYEVMRPLADRFDESGNGKPRRPLATRAEADAAFDNAVVRAAEEAKHCGRKRKPEPEAL